MTSCLNVSKNEAAKVVPGEKKVQGKCKIWVHTAVTGKDFDKDYSPILHCWKSKSGEMKGKLPAYSLHPEDSLTKLARLAHVNPHTPAESHTLDTYIFFISSIWQRYFQFTDLISNKFNKFFKSFNVPQSSSVISWQMKKDKLVSTGFLQGCNIMFTSTAFLMTSTQQINT